MEQLVTGAREGGHTYHDGGGGPLQTKTSLPIDSLLRCEDKTVICVDLKYRYILIYEESLGFHWEAGMYGC